MWFQFATASRIFFGEGCLDQVKEIAVESGKKAFVITGKGSAGPHKLFDKLLKVDVKWKQFVVEGEPTTELLQSAVAEARSNQCDFVVGFGGGSVLDTAKAVSAMLTNTGDILDYLEVVGKNLPIKNPAAAFIAIPTTAGTGTEVTRNAVLSVPEKRVKVSLRSYFIIPKYAVVDPELTYSMPPAITASSGTDALTQVLEPYVSRRANPMTDQFAKEGLRCASRSLRKAYQDGQNHPARRDMAWASLLGGLSLANAGLGAVHGFAGPLGGMYDAPHGAVCGRLLPFVTAMNIRALRTFEPESDKLQRYKEIAEILTGNPKATIEDGVLWLKELIKELKIPGLSTYGITPTDFPVIIEKSQRSSSMKGNPITLTDEQLGEILEEAL